jgi:chromosome segregation ATPase
VTEITELERRITDALARIDAGVDTLGQGGAGEGSGDTAALQEALEAEKAANAQLEERVAAIKDKQETLIKDLEKQISDLTATVARQEEDAKTLIALNNELREATEAQQATSGDKDAELVNKALQTELEALQTARKADLAELETIMTELKPLIGEGA